MASERVVPLLQQLLAETLGLKHYYHIQIIIRSARRGQEMNVNGDGCLPFEGSRRSAWLRQSDSMTTVLRG